MRYHQYLKSPLGYIKVVADEEKIIRINLLKGDTVAQDKKNELTAQAIEQLKDYFYQESKTFDLPLDIKGSAFDLSVYEELIKIPYGETLSYSQLAARLGNEDKAQAVGRSLGKNKLPIVIPCHRVIQANGELGGYAYGTDKKALLLDFERSGR